MGHALFDFPRMPPLRSILSDVREGRLFIPRFARPFVWKDEQRLQLLDSVYKGIPIGSLTVWRTNQREILPHYTQLGPYQIVENSSPNHERVYLLDGVQRVTTLFAALYSVDGFDDEVNEEGESTSWSIYFDLEQGASSGDATFRVPSRKPGWRPPLTWLPLNALFDIRKLVSFQESLWQNNKKELARDAERVANRFRDYAIPMIGLVTDDLDLVAETILRNNTGGTQISEHHLVDSLTHGLKNDIGAGLDVIRERLEDIGWSGLNDDFALKCLKIAQGLDLSVEQVPQLLSMQPDSQLFDDIADACAIAVQFLEDHCQIYDPILLPYEIQLLALVEAARTYGPLKDSRTRECLLQWFWATTYSSYFSNVTPKQLVSGITHVLEMVQAEEIEDPLPSDLNRTVDSLKRFNAQSPRDKAFALLLAEQEPLDQEGARFYASMYLAVAGFDALPRIIPKAFGADPANRFVSVPWDARVLREAFKDPARPNYEAICASHCISPEAARALVDGRHDEFLALRRQTIAWLEAEEMRKWGLMPPDVQAPAGGRNRGGASEGVRSGLPSANRGGPGPASRGGNVRYTVKLGSRSK